ncbi:F-box protein SKIP23 [Forsythia ovata]|uniref:F-box protein SKIP23 n=1 Tax=Forsythia ovata TaxID=205694 RepID=A0ABD1PHH2_9LAMI
MNSPLLMFPMEQENSFSFFSLANKREYELKADFDKLQQWRFVGSSHGWLLLLNEKADPILLNPFSGINFQLPGKETFPHIRSIQEVGDDVFEVHYKFGNESICHSSKTLRQLLMVKAVLSTNRSCNTNCTVIIMYNELCMSKLAFCRPGDSEWMGFGGEIQSYYDILCNDNMLYALGAGPSIEVWDLYESTPSKKMIIQASCPRKLTEAHQIYLADLYSSKWYLVFSSGEMLLVVRYIGEFVRYDGEVVYEGDTLTHYASEPLVCPYKTVQFHVYKLDIDQKIWQQVESLNDCALFVGGNHSFCLPAKEHPGCKGNAIYFTDDYWDRMDEDYCYGGHDMGIFKLGDGSIEPLLDCNEQKIEPTPFWIVPN